MARTTEMRLMELMILKEDVAEVIDFLGRKGCFQFQRTLGDDSKNEKDAQGENIDREFFERLQSARAFLSIEDLAADGEPSARPRDGDRTEASKLCAAVDDLKDRMNRAVEDEKRAGDAYREALAFSNLKVSYSELEHLSFLSLRIGKIDPKNFDDLKDAVGERAMVVALGDDKSRVLAASSKKGRFALDTELKKFGFVEMALPKDFKGIPDDALESLKAQKENLAAETKALSRERDNFAQTHKEALLSLLGAFSVGMQINGVTARLESTSLVYHVTGWVPASESKSLARELDELTGGRIAAREYLPSEVPSVVSGKEQAPVMMRHGRFVQGFERMIFSYGAPAYGTIDPTPFVAIFFTLLFGLMFGDAGQGLVILLLGILLEKKILKIGTYGKSAPVFIAVGASSTLMGLLTGEFFTTETLLKPFALFVTGLFGEPRSPIIKLMPSSSNTKPMFIMFGVAVAIGFVINSIGLAINIVNNFSRKKKGEALFGKTGLSGALFFWSVVALALRAALLHRSVGIFGIALVALFALLSAFGAPLARMVDGKRPVAENGAGALVISGIVELIEVVSTYLSNTVSFLRVGAFALSHAVLAYIIGAMTKLAGPVGGAFVLVIGNAVVVVLEGMIVAIQVVRLQYYEFFSKFFNETGVEFKPFRFVYERHG